MSCGPHLSDDALMMARQRIIVITLLKEGRRAGA
jgi:hypothetical protein